MQKTEVHLDLLFGKRVVARNGHVIGRLEEIEAETSGHQLLVKEYHVGTYAAFERFSAGWMGRALLNLVRIRRGGYRVPWNKLDISKDPPQLLCPPSELEPLDPV